MQISHGENTGFEHLLNLRMDAARRFADDHEIRVDAALPDHIARAQELTALWAHEQMQARATGPVKTIRTDADERKFFGNVLRAVAPAWSGLYGGAGPVRQDVNPTFQQNAQLAELGITIEIPHENKDELVMAVPTISVDPSKSDYVRRTVDVSGKAQHFRPGTTQSLPIAGITRGETRGRLHWMWAGQSNGWLDGMVERYGNSDDASLKAKALARMFQDGYRDAMMTRDAGLDYIAFDTLTPLYASGTSTFGSTAFDTLKAEVVLVLSRLSEATIGNAVRDTLVSSDRFMARLLGYANSGSGGSFDGNASRALMEVFSEFGIRRIIKGKALYDEGGTKVDGMWTMGTGDETGLKRVIAMAPAPLHSYVDASGTTTVWVTKHGGLDLPMQDRVAHINWSVT